MPRAACQRRRLRHALRGRCRVPRALSAPVVGGREHEELWVPAEDLGEFNRHIVGAIEVVAEFHSEP